MAASLFGGLRRVGLIGWVCHLEQRDRWFGSCTAHVGGRLRWKLKASLGDPVLRQALFLPQTASMTPCSDHRTVI